MTRPYPVAESAKADCGNCYGNGCLTCGMRGWIETEEGRDSREDAEDRRADAIRKGEW